ncbi:MAG TPA: TonB-dependent receptor [Bradyrhizobium sp.]|uniref:TonB-dependent receptor n=1 Tax=Bradyrhizobium sp. TaxID=376 RepID=UPI002C76DCD4|nr:TonB-dependent receptor [Bradyrhizobium sp.]HLZ04746.1 TonB-dependent receptor [Bradyrhizobium sp.]
MTKRKALKSALLLSCAIFPGVALAQEALPTIEVVGVSPVPGGEIDVQKVPSNVQTIDASDLDYTKSPTLLDGMVQYMPGVSLSDQSGNQFQRNLDYRGFTASPVPGTPQGIAVYQNGTRINEAFGDVVNWDLIPEMAIARMTMMPNNPLFGLNATGGALSIEMKNGFNYHGTEAQVSGGSYGRASAGAQSGYQNDTWSAYVAADTTYDRGWRDASSSSQVRRMYADLGARGDDTEFHISFTGADNKLGAVVATPVELLNQRWSSVYTWPQNTHLQLAFLQANAKWTPTDTFSVQANTYFRAYRASHFDANGSNAQPCDDGINLCIGDGLTPLNVNGPTPNFLPPNSAIGEIDRNQTHSNSFGGSLQATSTGQLFGHDNHFVVGTSIDHGDTNFRTSSELGTVDQNFFVTGTGVFLDQPAADVSPVNLAANNTYVGVYATNTFDITSQLSLTGGGRFNYAQINLGDLTGTNARLTSSNNFQRFNPVVGLTYRIIPNLTAYAGYSEANRAPTPLELGCSDPANPCQIDNFLISDPPLKQVVSHTIEGGLRGEFSGGAAAAEPIPAKAPANVVENGWRMRWGLSLFRTENTDDIISIASSVVPNFGFFQNAGTTLRQGVEAKVDLTWNRWTAYANYTFVDATYRSFLTLSSPNNPMATVDPVLGRVINVVPGDHIPGIPAHRLKIGGEYAITDAWKLGADVNFIGSQYLIHDDSNLNPKVPAYWLVNMHTSYQITKNVQVFGLVQNLFNQHYYSAGTFFSTSGFNNSTLGGPNLLTFNDPRTFLPGMPLAAYAGIKATF